MNRIVLSLLILLLSPSSAIPQPTRPLVADASADDNNNVPLLLKIPAIWIAKSVNRDFDQIAPVHQVILGTTSDGKAHCKGLVTCVVEDNKTAVSILCSIVGTVESKTRGTNGPAIIKSTALTHYTATKRLVFDGKRFAGNPTSISSSTQVTITGVGSSLPRLRGRLVTRIATKRAHQSLSRVEAIVKVQTEAELCKRIDADFDAKIVDMNHQFAGKTSILMYFPDSEHQIQFCSNKGGVEIALGHSPGLRDNDDESRKPIGEAFEIWLLPGEKLVANRPMTSIVFSKAPAWITTYLSNTPLFEKPDERKWGVEAREKWIVIKLYH